jgi:CheY-like chemotaxis protein
MSPRDALPCPDHPPDPGRTRRLPRGQERWSRRTVPADGLAAGAFSLDLAPPGESARMVLLIDGDDFARETLGRILEADGCRVAAAADAGTALARLRRQPAPGLMLLDAQTPGLEGGRSIWRLREALSGGVPVIVLSALAPAGGAGVTAYFEKPILVERLRAEVRRLLPPR